MTTKFEFDGIDRHGEYLFAKIKITIGEEIDTIGYTIIRMTLPFCATDQTLDQSSAELLDACRASIQTQPLLAWMDHQRALRARQK